MEFLSRHKITFVIAILIIAGFVWYGFSSGGTSSSTLISTDNPNASGDAGNKELVETLLALRAVSLSGTIFSDPVFLGLKDFNIDIIPESVGRADPFAPLSSSVRSGTDAKGTQLFAPAR